MGGSIARLFDTFNITGIDQTSASFSLPGSSSTSPAEAAKEASWAADARAKATAQELKDGQVAAARQAQERLNARRRAQIAGSQSIYTSPLGIGGTADVTRKTLLGA